MNAPKRTQEVSFVSSRFGLITVAAEKVIYFVQGIPGFSKLRRFILLDHDKDGLFRWLQSVDDPDVAFLLTDPALYKPGYIVPLKKSESDVLGATDLASIVTMAMVCVTRPEGRLSLNLKGPIIFNSSNMTALQCIIDREDYPSNYPIQ